MRRLIFILLLALPCLLTAQQGYIEFTAADMPENAEYDSIYWRGADKIHHEFTLTGSTATCRLRVIKRGYVLLEQQRANEWQVIDTLLYTVFPYEDDGYATPTFEVTDFNQDGLDDFMFLPLTNMHGSMAYYIYLQHTDGQLHILKNTAFAYNDENTWPAASFDAATQTISCQYPGGVFGSSWEAAYKLDGFTATPLQMHYQARNTQTWFDEYYTGNGREWQLSSQDIDIALGLGFDNYDSMDVMHYVLKADGSGTIQMYRMVDDAAVFQESFEMNGFLSDLEYLKLTDAAPAFMITDFNEDGNHDLVFYEVGGGHNAVTALVFITDFKSGKLVKLYNPADGTYLWDDPQYDAKNETITTSTSGGLHGIHTNTTYKIKNTAVTPIAKTEIDHTYENGITERYYKYKNGQWKLIKTIKQ